MGDDLEALENQLQHRYLMIAINNETGELDIDGSDFADWELAGIAHYLLKYADPPDLELGDEE